MKNIPKDFTEEQFKVFKVIINGFKGDVLCFIDNLFKEKVLDKKQRDILCSKISSLKMFGN